jgi:two-component system, OmpR family, sensor histidine kinase KdpD
VTPLAPSQAQPSTAPAAHHRWAAYAAAAGVCAAAVLVAWPLAAWLDAASLVLLFMLAVVLAGAAFGRGPALLAAGLSVLLFNLFFVPPRFSLSVSDERFLFTFGVMLVIGLIVGQLTAGLRVQAQSARVREAQMASLYAIARDLGSALTVERVAEIVQAFAAAQFSAHSTLRVRDRAGAAPAPPADADHPGTVLLALRGTMAPRGLLVLQKPVGQLWTAAERQLLDTCAALLGSALERIHYIEVAQQSAVQIEGERLRNSLLSAISHDLRTPLASLIGLSESLGLTRPPLAPQQAGIAQAMTGTARRMSALVNNLLDMARLESGAVRLDRQWQPAEEVIGSAIAAAADALGARRVEVRIADDLPLVRWDAVLMERVLVNLLENAAKYTPPESTIGIEARAQADEVVLAVADDGPGLPPGPRELLFRKFERGERESAIPGVGLGLALCRAIVEAHGGRIEAGDAPGGGARFEMRFALGKPPPLPAPDGLPPEAGP